jgi:hypothetical protein
MTLHDLQDLLQTIGVPVHHFNAANEAGNYIVWAEDGEGASGHADGKKTTQVIQGTIDYFTKDEFDPVVEQIQEKLNESDIAWQLNSIQHERDTGYIHYEWVWEMV